MTNPSSPEIVHPDPDAVPGYRIQDWDAIAGPAIQDYRTFWEDRAKELEWYEPWHTVLDDSKAPFYEWFSGAKVTSSTTVWTAGWRALTATSSP